MLFGSASILPNLVVQRRHLGRHHRAHHAVRGARRLCAGAAALPRQASPGFYVLATQMLPPVGLIIPYYLVLQNIGWLDTYRASS